MAEYSVISETGIINNNIYEIGKQIDSFDKMCRSCLSSEGALFSIFTLSFDDIKFTALFKMCASIEVKANDGLPKNICNTCILDLVRTYCFLTNCKQSDEALHKIVANKKSVQPNKKVVKKQCKGIIQEDINEEQGISISQSDQENEYNNVNSITRATSTRKPPYICHPCNVKFEYYHELKEHRNQVKHLRHPRNHTCTICKRAFSYNQLQQHMRTHTKEKPYQCEICEMSFSLSSNLKRHRMRHTGERPHICDICGKGPVGYIQAPSLKIHMRTHTGEKPYVCSYCGKSFTQSSQHNQHLRRHQIENGETNKLEAGCEVCGKMFLFRSALKTHMLTHGDKKFLCSKCGKCFVNNAGLQSHYRVHTGIRPYSCNVCGKAFSQLSPLKTHKLIHTGQRPFTCNICLKSYTQRPHLRYHMRTHSGEKPYTCSFCGKSYALKTTLTVHIRTHTGETPYLCDVCGKGFRDSKNLKKHRRGHESKM